MKSESVLIFEIESEYGHFRKFNTTSSPLTYSIPPRPAVIGIIGAILGIERETAPGRYNSPGSVLAEMFSTDNADIAVQILHPVKKVNIAFNLLDTEKTASSFFNVKQRTQIEFELLKNPKYRVFLAFRDTELQEKLWEQLKNNRTHFTPYLGLSQFTATISAVERKPVSPVFNREYMDILSAVNTEKTSYEFEFDYSGEFKYTSDTMPVELSKDRVVLSYAEVIMESEGKPIRLKSDEVFTVKDYGNLIFL